MGDNWAGMGGLLCQLLKSNAAKLVNGECFRGEVVQHYPMEWCVLHDGVHGRGQLPLVGKQHSLARLFYGMAALAMYTSPTSVGHQNDCTAIHICLMTTDSGWWWLLWVGWLPRMQPLWQVSSAAW